jgi:hypothetical protein
MGDRPLTVLHEKLAEAHGLAMAATTVVDKVASQLTSATLEGELATMRTDADETRARCLRLERRLDEQLAAEIVAHAQSTKARAADLAVAWFRAGTDPLRAITFLAMGEVAEVMVWRAVARLADRAGETDIADLAAWALPVQERHLELALEGAGLLAEQSDPAAPRWG